MIEALKGIFMRAIPASVLSILFLPGLVLAGCAPVPATKAAVSLPAPDGAWHGASTRFQADSRHCPGPQLLDIQVHGRQFDYRWARGQYITATIRDDNTLAGQDGEVTLDGTYSGDKIEGNAATPVCGLHFLLRRDG
jgi:hypothetical protein